jgi:hypothetical protein
METIPTTNLHVAIDDLKFLTLKDLAVDSCACGVNVNVVDGGRNERCYGHVRHLYIAVSLSLSKKGSQTWNFLFQFRVADSAI